MNIQQAKQLSLPEIMASMGYQPFTVKKGGTELWYLSPFRIEAKPSFICSFLGGKWIWNDFGDKGGTVLDFVMRHEGLTSVSEALTFLDNFHGTANLKKARKSAKQEPLFSFKQHPDFDASSFEKQLAFISATPIQNPVILNYLTTQRRIPKNLCLKYLKEIRYENKNTKKEFFAFGMENRSGGYEIRAATDEYPFKSALICRDVSVFIGNNPAARTVAVFEGMVDFLSLLALNKVETLEEDAIVMHSLSSFDKTVVYLREKGFERIELYLDNDTAGQEASERFKAEFEGRVVMRNDGYAGSKDLNEHLSKSRFST